MGILACSLLNYVVRRPIVIVGSLFEVGALRLWHAGYQDGGVGRGWRFGKLDHLTLSIKLVRVLTNVVQQSLAPLVFLSPLGYIIDG